MPISEQTRTSIARVWPEIMDAVATCSDTLEAAALKYAGVGVRSVQRYARETPGARKELDEALGDGAELMVARIPQLIMETPDARRARVLAEYTWKIAASRDSRFHDKSHVKVDVRSVDLTKIVNDAEARYRAHLAQSRPVLIDHATQTVLEDIL